MIRSAWVFISLTWFFGACATQPISQGTSDSERQGRQTEPVQEAVGTADLGKPVAEPDQPARAIPTKATQLNAAPVKATSKKAATETAKKKLKIIPHVIHETQKKPSKLPAVLQEIESKYSTAKTLEAQFKQITFQKALGKSKQSAGILKVKRPNKVRWETQQPDPNLLVSDGKTFWFYTPPFEAGDSGQLMTKKTSEVQSRLANALLSGSFSMAEDMKIETKDGSRFMLFPKPGSAGTVLRAEIVIDPVAKVIQNVNLFHQGGNEAKIQLSNIRLGTSEPDSTFQFTPPAGTEVIKN